MAGSGRLVVAGSGRLVVVGLAVVLSRRRGEAKELDFAVRVRNKSK